MLYLYMQITQNTIKMTTLKEIQTAVQCAEDQAVFIRLMYPHDKGEWGEWMLFKVMDDIIFDINYAQKIARFIYNSECNWEISYYKYALMNEGMIDNF